MISFTLIAHSLFSTLFCLLLVVKELLKAPRIIFWVECLMKISWVGYETAEDCYVSHQFRTILLGNDQPTSGSSLLFSRSNDDDPDTIAMSIVLSFP